jgi:hypothetical protein
MYSGCYNNEYVTEVTEVCPDHDLLPLKI